MTPSPHSLDTLLALFDEKFPEITAYKAGSPAGIKIKEFITQAYTLGVEAAKKEEGDGVALNPNKININP